jgi:hypothetical protein
MVEDLKKKSISKIKNMNHLDKQLFFNAGVKIITHKAGGRILFSINIDGTMIT